MKDRGVVFLQAFLMVCVCMVAYALPGFADDDIDDSVLMGSFKLTPIVTVTQEYNDNIYTEPSNKAGDFVTRVIPSLTAEYQENFHRFKLDAELEQVWFADETQNHYLNYNVGFRERYNLEPTLLLDVSGSIQRTHSMPGDDLANPAADAGEPLPLTQYRGSAGFHKRFANLKIAPHAALRRLDYSDVRRVNGALIDQGDRDRTEYDFGGRVSYGLEKGYTVFTDLAYEPVDYSRESTTDRDSRGGSALAGLRYRPNKTLLAEASAGYLTRRYRSIIYDDVRTADAKARIRWQYDEDSTLDLRFDRYMRESTDAGVGGAIADDVRFTLEHALSPVWKVRTGLRFRNSAYQGGNGADNGTSDRNDRYYAASLGLDYALSERVSLSGAYDYARNQSNRSAAEYVRNVFMLGLKVGY